jgi:CheY-like chemotaxis protein
MARAIRGLRMAVVLVVEDEEQVRVLAVSYLEEQGHQVLSAGSPQGATALLEKTPHVDLLFTDLDLKGDIAAGIKLAREALKHWPHLKVLYTTGRDLTDGMEVAVCQELSLFGEAVHCRGIAHNAHHAFKPRRLGRAD